MVVVVQRSEVDINKVTPMMRQYLEIKNQNEDIILFFRLGDFYEMFFEDAILVSRELELTLTGKNAGLEERIPMCGIPYHAVSIYLDKLTSKGYKVGICEQLEDPASAKGIVKRDITQIVSKGTVFNEESLVAYENNYIGAINDYKQCYVVTYMDVSTGQVDAFILPHKQTNLISEVVSIGIKEIIIKDSFDKTILSILKNQFKIPISIFDTTNDLLEYRYIYEDVNDPKIVDSLKYLLTYISETQKRNLSHLKKVNVRQNREYLKMDIHTKRNLELTETLRLKQRNYSLIWLLDKTKTAMGARKLKNWIENPLVNVNEIEKRYDMVDTLITEFILKDDLIKDLDEVYDLERLSGRIAFGNANARDLLQLKNSLQVLPHINQILTYLKYTDKVDPMTDLYNLLEASIYLDPPVSVKEGYLIKEGYNQELDELKDLRKGGKDFVARFEAEEREKTGIKNLKVGYNKVFGYYIEVSKGNIDLVKDEYGYERKQTLTNCERYISPVLKEKEALILNAEERIIELEYELFIDIRNQVKTYIPNLQRASEIISTIDVLQSFASVAEENNYVRPKLNTERKINIIDNRHPVVEKVLNNEYVSNDVIMDEKTDILLITGPNMAGKSTYMRQMAITVIMAQIGCFVPAKEASLPVFDAIFTRIGASDDLVSGESTFMVEMNEANNALSNASKDSLILFDELGRGTATFDGMALAQSIIEYIHNHVHAKTMFSTHYHELTDLDQSLSKLKNVHVSAVEENGNLIFLHKIKNGSIDKSYGIHVAKLASLPSSLIERASQILEIYENKEKKRDTKIQEALPLDALMEKESEVEREIKECNALEMTPIEALNKIWEWKEKVK